MPAIASAPLRHARDASALIRPCRLPLPPAARGQISCPGLTRAQLGKYPYLNEFEKQTGVSKVYVVLGLAATYFFLIFFNVAAEFLVNTIGFIIPAYYSLHALFTAGTVDDTQWLTVCHS